MQITSPFWTSVSLSENGNDVLYDLRDPSKKISSVHPAKRRSSSSIYCEGKDNMCVSQSFKVQPTRFKL